MLTNRNLPLDCNKRIMSHAQIKQYVETAMYYMGQGVPKEEALRMAKPETYHGHRITRLPYQGDDPRLSALPKDYVMPSMEGI